MRIVSSQTDADMRRSDTTGAVERAALRLAVNVLRVVRGAGKPHELLPNMNNCVRAAEAFMAAHGHWPVNEVANALSLPTRTNTRELPDFEYVRENAFAFIIDGALQMAASKLAEQPMHEAAGEREMMRGVDQLEAQSAALRAEHRRALRAAKAPRKKPTPRKRKG